MPLATPKRLAKAGSRRPSALVQRRRRLKTRSRSVEPVRQRVLGVTLQVLQGRRYVQDETSSLQPGSRPLTSVTTFVQRGSRSLTRRSRSLQHESRVLQHRNRLLRRGDGSSNIAVACSIEEVVRSKAASVCNPEIVRSNIGVDCFKAGGDRSSIGVAYANTAVACSTARNVRSPT